MNFMELHRNIKIRLYTSFFQRTAKEMIFPFMSLYLSNYFGWGLAGVLMAISLILGIFSMLISGYISDRIGRKKIILYCELFNSISLLAMAIFNTELFFSPFMTYLFFCFNSLISNFSMPALNSMIIDVSNKENRKLVYSVNYWIINLSISVGSILGALLFYNFFKELLIGTSIISIIIFLIYLVFISETFTPMHNKDEKTFKNLINDVLFGYSSVLKNRLFMLFFIGSLLVMAIEFQLINYINIRLNREFGSQSLLDIFGIHIELTGIEMYGLLRTESTLIVVFLTFFVYRVIKKLNDRLILKIGLILFTGGYMILASVNNPWILILSMFVLTIGELMYSVINQAYLPQLIEEDNHSKYMAVYGLSQRGGQLIASVFISLGSLLSPMYISLIIGLIGLTSVFLFDIVMKKENNTKN